MSKSISSSVTWSPISVNIGASFTGLTVNSNTSLSDAPSLSVIVTAMDTTPFWLSCTSNVNTPEPVLSPDVVLTITKLSSLLTALKTKLWPFVSTSTSVPVISILKSSSSFVTWSPISVNIGASFTDITSTTNVSDATDLPCKSSTMNITVSVPFQFSTELNSTINSSITICTSSFPVTLNTSSSPSTSSTYSPKSSVIPSSSLNTTLSGKSITGLSFTGNTVNTNSSLSLNSPSLTDTCISTLPLKFWNGVKVNNVSSTTTLTSEGLLLTALNVNGSPSTSTADNTTVNGISSSVSWSPINDNSGASFTGTTSTTNVSNATDLPCKSSTMNTTVSVPFQFSTELNSTINSSITICTFSFPVTLNTSSSPSISSIYSPKSSVIPSSSLNTTLSGKSITGSSFTGNTVNTNTSFTVYSPSDTDTLIYTSPW